MAIPFKIGLGVAASAAKALAKKAAAKKAKQAETPAKIKRQKLIDTGEPSKAQRKKMGF